MYRFGAIFAYLSVSYVLSTVVVSEVFLPIYYRLGINSIYEVNEIYEVLISGECFSDKLVCGHLTVHFIVWFVDILSTIKTDVVIIIIAVALL